MKRHENNNNDGKFTKNKQGKRRKEERKEKKLQQEVICLNAKVSVMWQRCFSIASQGGETRGVELSLLSLVTPNPSPYR